MNDTASSPLPPGTRSERCVRCGGAFGCGVDAPGCWCAGLPALRAPASMTSGTPDTPGGCLCESCLRDALLVQELEAALAAKTMPAGALGRLGRLAVRTGRILRTRAPRVDAPQVVVFAADHGLAAAGVSAYPQAVTAQMLHNFAAGGAAVNVLARANGAALTVADLGVAWPGGEGPPAGVIDARVAPGTADCTQGPAMTREQARTALARGEAIVAALPGNVVAFGEMGIGNTSSASLLVSKLSGAPLDACTGRGTGLDDAGLARKRAILARAADRHAAEGPRDPVGLLAAVGGLEIAAIAGGMLGAMRRGAVILVDGFIVTAALMVAHAIDPRVTAHCVFSHRSAEAGHRVALDWLGRQAGTETVDPLLDLGLRLGEGTGAVLALPLLVAACDILRDMATFESAGVSDRAPGAPPSSH